MSEIKLSLQQPDENAAPPPPPPSSPDAAPIAGYFAIGLALAGIFTSGAIFVPLAFLASVIALFSGQIIWGIFGILLSFAGLITSPVLLAFLGLAWIASIVGV
ncbi:MAG: hypothetical protein HQ513_17785 [Rhodospirillales bacterium]|nr:hypothetical protein [Rhodospirillales bacterium]